MANDKRYSYHKGDRVHVTFDPKGDVVEARGFEYILWCNPDTINEKLIGMNIEQLAELIREQQVCLDEYYQFEATVHLNFLKDKLSQNEN